MSNLAIYNEVREVPAEAQKEIGGGRLKGMTDINPMWRIKKLTEQFGPCGEGWKYVIKGNQFVTGGKDEIAVFVDIDLYYKVGDEWSEPIPGTGGSMFVENEQRGPHVNDECIKMALTDAISVACKALGFGADVYWNKDKTKYNGKPASTPQAPLKDDDFENEADVVKRNCDECGVAISQKVKNYSDDKYGRPLCMDCQKEEGKW